MQKFSYLLILCSLIVWLKADLTYLDYYLQANSFEDVKNYQQAIECYQKSIEQEPRFPNAYNGLGFVYLEMQDYQKATDYFNQALQLKPNFILPLINLGACYYRQGDLQKAQAFFEKVLKIDPNVVEALTNLAVIKFKYRDYWGAFHYYQKAKSVNIDYLKKRYNKEKSLQEINEALIADPDNLNLKILKEKIENEEIFF